MPYSQWIARSLALVASLVCGGALAACGHQPAPPAAPPPGAAVRSSTVDGAPGGAGAPSTVPLPAGTAPPLPAPELAPPVALGFARAWARPDLPADKWWAAVAPWCAPDFATQLRTVDPGNLPATRVTGGAVAAGPPANGGAVYTVATDGGILTVTVAVVNGRWLATGDDFRRGAR
jgi:hypothetical protein